MTTQTKLTHKEEKALYDQDQDQYDPLRTFLLNQDQAQAQAQAKTTPEMPPSGWHIYVKDRSGKVLNELESDVLPGLAYGAAWEAKVGHKEAYTCDEGLNSRLVAYPMKACEMDSHQKF